ncbi:MAG: hypothetical protein AB7I59_26145 [Geminicoccaceae bacterium]
MADTGGNGRLWGTCMRLKHAVAAVVALLLIASLATWMFASEDPPPVDAPPPLEAGQQAG